MNRVAALALISGLFLSAFAGGGAGRRATDAQIAWRDCLNQKPAWYGSAEAIRIADNVLLYQRDSGGWPKNIDMAAALDGGQKADLAGQKRRPDSTIDNRATYTQMAFLARVYNATKTERFKDSFLKGVDFLLRAQYENGGWPQYYPDLTGYRKHITFNDDAMIGVMSILRDIAGKDPVYAFVDGDRRARAEKAVQKGIECILNCQIVVNGARTVWCAQHDEKTLAPAPARSYEKVSLSGSESVGIVRFLMSIDRPGPRVVEAIQAAVSWFDQVKITGIKLVKKQAASLPGGFDLVVVEDPGAEPLWARFYEIGSNRPIFSGRDGIVKYSLAQIEPERRIGYRWYVSTPAVLLKKDYPAWRKKVGLAKAGWLAAPLPVWASAGSEGHTAMRSANRAGSLAIRSGAGCFPDTSVCLI
jgi:PelA/Pel-15E family pectate lyase